MGNALNVKLARRLNVFLSNYFDHPTSELLLIDSFALNVKGRIQIPSGIALAQIPHLRGELTYCTDRGYPELIRLENCRRLLEWS